MKKIYIAPETEVCDMSLRNYLLVGSTPEGRIVTGGITSTTDGVTTGTGTTSETTDPYDPESKTNRAPGFFGGFDE